MKDKELVWMPKELAEKIKSVEDNDVLMNKEVICYVERTKKDISSQVELLDDDVLMFKSKLASYKKAFKEAYESADTEMYSFWEDFDKRLSVRYKSLRNRMDSITSIYDREFRERKEQVESLSKSMKEINTYQFDSVITFLRSFESLSPETKELFIGMVTK